MDINYYIKTIWESGEHSWNDVAALVNAKFGETMTGDACRKRYDRHADKYEETDSQTVGVVGGEFTQSEMEENENILQKLLADAGLDTDAWNIVRSNIKRYGVPLRVGDETVLEDNWSVHAVLEPIGIGVSPASLLGEISRISKIAEKGVAYGKPTRNGKLFIPSLYDTHLEKAAIQKTESVELTYIRALRQLIESAGEFEHTLFVIGNDYGNLDNLLGTTTAGTAQNNKMDFYDGVKLRCALIITAIKMILNHSDVTVMVIPGNHDRATSYWLGLYVQAYFNNNDRVTVINSGLNREYFRWGNNMFMFTHGDGIKWAEVIGVMASEEPVMFAETKYREVFTGHLHSFKQTYVGVRDAFSVMVRFMPALSVKDRWHSDHFYVGARRGAVGLVYGKERGWLYEFPAFVD
jgi:hypothetical protein